MKVRSAWCKRWLF